MTAFAAALFWAIDPFYVLFSVRIWESSLSASLSSFAVYWYLHLLDSPPRRRDWIAYGVLWGVAALVSTTLVLMMPLGVAALCYRWGRQARRNALIAFLVFASMLIPWTVRNYVVFHKLIPIRANFGPQLWYGNHPGVQGPADEAMEPLRNRNELKSYCTMGERQYTASRQQMALQFIRQNPWKFIRLTCARILFVWSGAGIAFASPAAPGVTPACWSILAFSGLLMMLRTEPIRAIPFAGALLLFPLPYYVTLALLFYRHPIDPLITLLVFNAVFSLGESAMARLTQRGERKRSQSCA